MPTQTAPQPTFESLSRHFAHWEKIGDLTPGMVLEGVVTNVAAFGAFVDVGVHQDGLVHVSQLADRFVKDPREVVKAGDIVKVKVVDVDLKRRRIALTMKLNQVTADGRSQATGAGVRQPTMREQPARMPPPDKNAPRPNAPATSMAAAFSRLSKPK